MGQGAVDGVSDGKDDAAGGEAGSDSPAQDGEGDAGGRSEEQSLTAGPGARRGATAADGVSVVQAAAAPKQAASTPAEGTETAAGDATDGSAVSCADASVTDGARPEDAEPASDPAATATEIPAGAPSGTGPDAADSDDPDTVAEVTDGPADAEVAGPDAEADSEAEADSGTEADSGGEEAPAKAGGGRGLLNALGLTVASAVVWGIAHLWAGRRVAGVLLMGLFAILVGGGVFVALRYQHDLKQIAVQRDWLEGITGGILALALLWAGVVVRSYQVVRPTGMAWTGRILAGGMVLVLVVGVCSPLVWAARSTYTLRDTIGTIFHGDQARPQPVNVDDPWKDKPRVNILLLGGDGAGDRVGIRTDSMTVASIDTKTGDTVLLSLPRNLQHFPVIPRLRSRWPDGFTGVGAPGDEGLLNELFQDAEDDPSLVPGFDKGRRGPELVREEISYLIGQPIDYYILVNLFGFADIVDAMGGVKVHIAQDIPFGGPEDGSAPTGVLKAGDRDLSGKEALWYGRSRTASDDFTRMGRQKCLMKAIAEQADPQRVLTRFQQLAAAAKKTISSNIPAELLPALIKLSETMKHGAQISSLMFVPPQFHVYRPDLQVMRRAAAAAIEASGERSATASPTPEVSGAASTSAQPSGTPGPVASPAGMGSPVPSASAGASAGESAAASPDDSAGPSAGADASGSASPKAGAKDKAVSLTAACGG
ncbi:LCP family glycopolymer transferase [Actinoallomurus rhizosphaericola]|uniref:LCP family glycopolymer transferase n=1 Tax=Actinoallomurus rhizosphaericola TaxID=2952536 RepID=UPI002090D55B|nr:LCP family protein [Actinoallomurus rhizosphaericola]MCO5992847.1 LCP family protein [Actinoallomurus rhizosphaericola]